MSKDEVEALADLDTADLDYKTLVALKYVEHLAKNKGKLLDPQLLQDVRELYTDKQVRYIDNGWAFANGMNWMGNRVATVFKKLHIYSSDTLEPKDPAPLQSGIT